MGLVASCVLSVTGDDRVCRFCYGDDDQDGRWLRPCKCRGSLKWVHLRCFDHWMMKAPAQQQTQCQTCRYIYVKSWVLKPFNDWCRPAIKLSAWECLEILLDTYSTYKFLRGFKLMLEGQRSIIVQSLHFLFWRIFIATDRRVAYYASLGRQMLSSIFVISIKDCEFDETESFMHWLKEKAVNVISFIVREPSLFIQYVVLAAIAAIMFTMVMQYKIQKSLKKQEKIRKQKEKILRKLHGSRKKSSEEEVSTTLEKRKDD